MIQLCHNVDLLPQQGRGDCPFSISIISLKSHINPMRQMGIKMYKLYLQIIQPER